MAIINCPECNEKISDTVQQCIHCGVKITVCPECKRVYTENIKSCAECGYMFEGATSSKAEQRNTKVTDTEELDKKWNIENTYVKVIKSPILGYVLKGLSVLLIIIAAIKLADWKINTPSWMGKAFSSVKACFIFAMIFDLLGDAYKHLKDLFLQSNYIKWVKSKGIKLIQPVENSFSLEFSEMVPEEAVAHAKCLKFATYAEIYDNDIVVRKNYFLQKMLTLASNLIGGLLVTIFFIINAEIFMKAELMKSSVLNISGFTFSMIEHWWLIILSILINVAMALYEKASESNIEKRRVEWINKNMPKNAYKYEVYIKNPTEFLTEKKDSSRGRIV